MESGYPFYVYTSIIFEYFVSSGSNIYNPGSAGFGENKQGKGFFCNSSFGIHLSKQKNNSLCPNVLKRLE